MIAILCFALGDGLHRGICLRREGFISVCVPCKLQEISLDTGDISAMLWDGRIANTIVWDLSLKAELIQADGDSGDWFESGKGGKV